MNLLSQFNAAFVMYGFSFWYNSERNESSISYKGILKTLQFGDVKVEFYFYDQTLTALPKAFIVSQNIRELQPYHFPHLDGEWQLCYDDGAKIFDKFKPEDMVLFSITSVTSVLNDIIPHDMNEIIPEFRYYWKSSVNYYGIINKYRNTIFIIQNKEVESQNNDWDFNMKKEPQLHLFEIPCIPSFEDIKWPIDSLNELEIWLKDSRDVYNSIVGYCKEQISDYKKVIHVVIHSAQERYTFGLDICIENQILNKAKMPPLMQKTIDNLLKHSSRIKKRFWIETYSINMLLRSNRLGTDFKDLSNKRILLIGAGTVGSNLANILIRNGAGTGMHGSLTLVDNDIFEPYNFSRHFLGLNSSGVYKVDALTEELLRLAPFCRIIPDKRSIYDFPIKPNKYDLIIDSTGEEALTIWLNDLYWKLQEQNCGIAPLYLSVWVKGMGEAVECFTKQDNRQACHECFRMSKYSIKKSDQTLPLRDSCRSIYVPFPVTASLYASLLAIHVINKWLDRSLDTSNYFKQNINPVGSIEENFIPTNKECPTCGNSYIEE